MLIIRLFFVLAALTMAVSGVMYLLTRNPRFSNFAWHVARFTIYTIVIMGLVFLLERYGLSAWRAIF